MKKLLMTLVCVLAMSMSALASPPEKTHTIKEGETLHTIATYYKTTVDAIKKANPGIENMFVPGVKVKIPDVGSKTVTQIPDDESKTVTHTTEKEARTDSEGNAVYHHYFVVAQYQMGDFKNAKVSGCYGLGVIFNSISHWGRFHVGGNVNFSVNAGFVHDWGCIFDFGPSCRFDINRDLFVNVPVDAVCCVTFPEGSTDSETSWGAKIAPSIHAFLSSRFGLFAGPQLSIGFSDGSKASFGFQAGVSYAF